MEVAIDRIRVVGNPRTDFGDLTELVASVRNKGIIEPLIVVQKGDDEYELVAGERRLLAAKQAGLATVPVDVKLYEGADEIEEVKLEENIHRKDLNFFEEGDAFKRYLDRTKKSVETLATKVSKPKAYIDRRLAVAQLDDATRQRILKHRLTLTHAVYLARMQDNKARKKMLNDAIRDELPASAMVNHQYRLAPELRHARFDMKLGPNGDGNGVSGCSSCPHNGGNQASLIDGKSATTGMCLKPKCFSKKTAEHRQEVSAKLKKEGVKVLMFKDSGLPWEAPEGYKKVSTYDFDGNQRRKLRKHGNAAVAVTTVGEAALYFRGDPRKAFATKADNKSAARSEQEEKDREQQCKAVLKDKVVKHMTQFFLANARERARKNDRAIKALTLHFVASKLRWDCDLSDERTHLTDSLKLIYKLKDEEIDAQLATAMRVHMERLLPGDMKRLATEMGIDAQKDFVVTIEFLELHTKNQLEKLAKEFQISVGDAKKKTELVATILKHSKGKVPKAVM